MEEARTDKGIRVNRSQLLGAEVAVLILMVTLLYITLWMAHTTQKNHYFDMYDYLNNRQGEIVYYTIFTDDERARWDAAIQEIGQENQNV